MKLRVSSFPVLRRCSFKPSACRFPISFYRLLKKNDFRYIWACFIDIEATHDSFSYCLHILPLTFLPNRPTVYRTNHWLISPIRAISRCWPCVNCRHVHQEWVTTGIFVSFRGWITANESIFSKYAVFMESWGIIHCWQLIQMLLFHDFIWAISIFL